MNRILLGCCAALLAHPAAATPPGALAPTALQATPEQAHTAYVAAQLLSHNHYRAPALDDTLSAKIFDRYLQALDPDRIFFNASDIETLGRWREQLDDAILNEDLSAPLAIFNVAVQRAQQRYAYARSLLAGDFDDFGDFDLRQGDGVDADRPPTRWPPSEAQAQQLWRQRVRHEARRLRLAGNDEQAIARQLDQRYAHAAQRSAGQRGDDAFETFMNAFTTSIEPHSNYLAPARAQQLDIAMQLALVGVGASVAEVDGQLTVVALAPGGPASRSGQVGLGDRLLGAAQGESGAMREIAGWRLDDVASLLRGVAGTTVRLQLVSGESGESCIVTLVRETIHQDDESARKTLISVRDGALTRRIGVITLPAFYHDFAAQRRGEPDFKSASRDVERLLAELQSERVDGVLIDLRDNGGGSLDEAIALTGLFIDRGPVVQQRDAQGEISVGLDSDPGTAWDGPLGVLINRGSASAAEIFAAAIQDYQRGVLIGERSFGKGTVQMRVDLGQYAAVDGAPQGELKFTVAQTFRINGRSTQRRGVVPDIVFPAADAEHRAGEAAYDNALPWSQLKALAFAPLADLQALRAQLRARHRQRLRHDAEWRSLRGERDQAFAVAPHAERRDDGLLDDERRLADRPAPEDTPSPGRDVRLIEAAHIVGDQAALLARRSALARNHPGGSRPTPATRGGAPGQPISGAASVHASAPPSVL